MRRRPIQRAALAALAALAGCGPEGAPPGGPGGAPRAGPRGAIVILLDTLRADRLGCYGNARPATPALDALAAEGARFETVVSSAPWTLPSVGAFLAAREPARAFAGEGLAHSLAESFAQAGFATAAFTEGAFVSRHFGMDRGFEDYDEQEGSVLVFEEQVHTDAGIARTFARARAWLEQHGERPFFLFIHTYEPHTPYNHFDFAAGSPPPRIGWGFGIEQLERLRRGELVLDDAERGFVAALYEGDILSADRHVGELVSFLRERGLWERTLVAVTSDHGEELGAHSAQFIFDHGHSLHDDLLLVPLVLRDPTRAFPVRRVAAQVRLIDVLPTVAELCGVRLAEDLDGRSLVPYLTGAESEHRLALLGSTKRGPPRVGLRDGRHKLVRAVGPDAGEPVAMSPAPPAVELYDLAADPGETRNLAPERPRLVEALSETLERRRGAADGPHGLPDVRDPALRERLRSLGYVE